MSNIIKDLQWEYYGRSEWYEIGDTLYASVLCGGFDITITEDHLDVSYYFNEGRVSNSIEIPDTSEQGIAKAKEWCQKQWETMLQDYLKVKTEEE